jgi:hypothetical protein
LIKIDRKGKQRQERVFINEERRKGWDLKKYFGFSFAFAAPICK